MWPMIVHQSRSRVAKKTQRRTRHRLSGRCRKASRGSATTPSLEFRVSRSGARSAWSAREERPGIAGRVASLAVPLNERLAEESEEEVFDRRRSDRAYDTTAPSGSVTPQRRDSTARIRTREYGRAVPSYIWSRLRGNACFTCRIARSERECVCVLHGGVAAVAVIVVVVVEGWRGARYEEGSGEARGRDG